MLFTSHNTIAYMTKENSLPCTNLVPIQPKLNITWFKTVRKTIHFENDVGSQVSSTVPEHHSSFSRTNLAKGDPGSNPMWPFFFFGQNVMVLYVWARGCPKYGIWVRFKWRHHLHPNASTKGLNSVPISGYIKPSKINTVALTICASDGKIYLPCCSNKKL